MDRYHALSLDVKTLERLWEKRNLDGMFEELLREISCFLRPREPCLREVSREHAELKSRVRYAFLKGDRLMVILSDGNDLAALQELDSGRTFEFTEPLPRRSQFIYDPFEDHLYVTDLDRRLLLTMDLFRPENGTVKSPLPELPGYLSVCGGRLFLARLLIDGRISLSIVQRDLQRKSCRCLPLWTSTVEVSVRHIHDFTVVEESKDVCSFAVMAGDSIVGATVGLSGNSCLRATKELWSRVPISAPFLRHLRFVRFVNPNLILLVTTPYRQDTSSLIVVELRGKEWFIVKGDPSNRTVPPELIAIKDGFGILAADEESGTKKLFSVYRLAWE
ncbi:hypothetical protein FOL47_010766 [Perkinsus chesapeaki]|uniref:Uncharacterized protein n=1 Tax=Perkinsus chesapeaki TaxID=330153 RepID=A0A7J6L283_PERCH|nr:hypothetical protein FOL47_010766 [Perkinsus chesapeaki]